MLSFLLWLPILGAIIIGFFPAKLSSVQWKRLTTVLAVVVFAATIWLVTQFDLSHSGLQFREYFPWAKPIGLSYSLAIDGLSLPLLALNSLLTIIAIYSIGENVERPRLYYALTLLINAGITGALVAQNLLLFVIFYELELIPFYLMIAIWGGEKRGYASVKFLLYTALSGLLVLAGFLGIGFLSGATNFDYDTISTQGLSLNTQLILLTALLIGFGIKIPLVPLHTWLPDAYTEASPAVAILLGGILAKLGTYGLIRFGLQLFPQAWHLISPGLAIIGTISVLYGALSAIAQKDIKRMVAYSSIGHMGYILVAAAAGTQLSILGAVAQMISHGLILALLFHLVGIVERKVGTRDLDVLNGLMNPIRGLPLTSALLVMAGMASAGIPGLVGFVAEFIVFQGSFTTFPIPILFCIIASGLTAVYFVILLNRTCFGKLDNKLAYYPPVLKSESIPAFALTILILFLGIQPNWLLRWMEPTTDVLASQINQTEQVVVSKKSNIKKNNFNAQRQSKSHQNEPRKLWLF
ncbi:proton-translocating NADH-quinone oxidoreductase, chain M [Rippkaea orientalis PCC 8801]|uniref:Proton-translocating NADH-quinone oxidoreductase, chain M n=1 Tax=Rippkaea orientalis (strain PCC 8801 / RF-1) TaxID=41431 RepID=B7K6C0_RIPO1|nr:NADH-quinone oxidoreductase subunit M [Rippkaea orientalis]ACK68173.1 proton-translocating NADH-quinone oxidoreductase, chain M [Rippkaea orientalis PCC 8801]